MAEPIYEELGLVRIQRWQGEELGRPELTGARLAAAAGARQLAAAALWCTAVETEGSYGLLASPGTWGRARKGPAWARATVAPWPAAWNLRARWLS